MESLKHIQPSKVTDSSSMKRQRDDSDDAVNVVAEDDSTLTAVPQTQKKKTKTKTAIIEELPKGVVLYTDDTIPWDLLKYWQQRHKLFKRFNEGIWLTDAGWYSVTPESVAKRIASDILHAETTTPRIIVDGFCGVGGNAIQFALNPLCEKVIAIDNDAAMIACAKHNAAIHGVENKIEFLEMDFFDFTRQKGTPSDTNGEKKDTYDAVFLSPPWGGPTYMNDAIFDLEKMEPHSGTKIMTAAKLLSENIALYVPRNSDLRQIALMAPKGKMVDAVHYCLNRRSKAICVYFGDWW